MDSDEAEDDAEDDSEDDADPNAAVAAVVAASRCSTLTMRHVWERLEAAFICVAATLRFASPALRERSESGDQ